MPVTQKYPTTRPALLLNFARSRQLDPRITFTRASTGTIVNSSGLIETVADNRPRFTFNPITLASEGLLIEESRTNLFTYSSDFNNAVWTKSATIIANTAIAPDGTLTADTLQETSASQQHLLQSTSVGVVSIGAVYTVSCFAKMKERTQISLTSHGESYAVFDLSNGTIVQGGSQATITAYPKGWYRCTATFTKTNTNGAFYIIIWNGSNVYTGDNTSGLYIWGSQVEAGPFATSYIPTTASQVTRQTDVATMTGTNFSSWYNTVGSTIVTEGKFNVTLSAGQFGAAWTIGSTGTNRYSHIYNPSAAGGAYVVTDNVVQMNTSGTYSGAFASNAQWKHAFALATNDCAEVVNAGTPATDNSVTLPTSTIFWIGANSGGIVGSQTISKIAYYNSRLSNAQLQELTR